MDDPLKILGLKPGDSLKTALKKRNALYLVLHPDKNPSDKSKFQEVYDAYDTILKNPKLLDLPIVSSVKAEQIIRVRHTVSMRDFYFKVPQTITIKRKVFCRTCGGSGSATGETGHCPHCEGTGKIVSSILSLLGKDSTCPMCQGSGFKSGSLCKTCTGHRYLQEISSIQFVLEPINFHQKVAVLHNVGDQISKDSYGTVSVALKVSNNTNVTIEENYFVTYDNVSPVQKIIGDTKTLRVFGREITYQIPENSTEVYINDVISPEVTQELRIKFIDIPPLLTRETVDLYKKILEIEKNYETNDGFIQF